MCTNSNCVRNKDNHTGLVLNEVMSNGSTMVDAFDITSFEICVPTPTVYVIKIIIQV